MQSILTFYNFETLKYNYPISPLPQSSNSQLVGPDFFGLLIGFPAYQIFLVQFISVAKLTVLEWQ